MTSPRQTLESRPGSLRSPQEEPPQVVPHQSVRLFATLLRHRRSIVLAGLAGAVLFGTIVYRRSFTYTASIQAIVDSRRPSTVLSDITAQLGFGALTTDGGPSPHFYAELITSRLVLGAVVDSVYEFPTDTGQVRGNLVELYGIDGSNAAGRREEAVLRLRRSVSRAVAPRTGILTVEVKMPYPELAPLVVERLIAEVNRVNVESRQSQASNEREFTAQRMREAAIDLRTAEDALQTFLQQNRAARAAPRTAIEEDRLIRNVAMRQAIYTSVAQAYEQARIDEARDTPGLRIIEPPVAPITRDPRGLARALVFGTLVGGVIMGLLVVFGGYLQRAAREDPEGYANFHRSLRAAGSEVVRPWRWFRAPPDTAA
jgi:uncharacterized protein involved in exopolysaccharide biosynthesis